jgi:diacylglycerol kinase (ATP)
VDEVMVFANPISGRGKGKTTAARVEAALQRAGHRVRVQLQRSTDIPSEDLKGIGGAKAIVVIGGDGTLRSVVERVVQECGRSTPPPFLVVPMGTANLMGKYLGIRWDDQTVGAELAQVIAGNKKLKVDAATIREHGKPDDRLMLLMAGIGIDAKVVHELDRIRQGPISLLSYALPAAMALGFYQYPSITVIVDKKEVWRGPGISIVGNVKEYGTGFAVLPDARPDDGLLDICAMPCKSRGDLIKLFLMAAAGEHLTHEGVVYIKGTHVSVLSEEPVPAQVDGEASGFTPLEIELMPERIEFLVP